MSTNNCTFHPKNPNGETKPMHTRNTVPEAPRLSMSLLLFVGLAACSGTTSESGSEFNRVKQPVQTCEEAPDWADDCHGIKLSQADTWQATVANGEPPWRTVTETSNGDPLVVIDTLDLNAGLNCHRRRTGPL